MKKLFVGVLAIAGLVACAQEEVLRTQVPGQIGFDGAYVENAVRAAEDPSTTTDNLTAFDVWGYMTDGTGIVFNREVVSGGTGAWDYVNKQYWVPGKVYRFFALAPSQSENVEITLHQDAYTNAIQTLAFTNVDGTEDLLYASKEDVAAPAQGAQTADKVTFAFDHILSKIKFAFTNGIENENAYIVVKGIRLEVPAQGTIELNKQGEYTWANQAGTTTLEFGHMDKGAKIQGLTKGECDYERLTIPAGPAQEYKVTFNVEFYMGDVLATSTAKSAVINGVTFEPGKAYKLTATLNKDNVAEDALLPIEFDVEKVNEWVDGGVYDGDGNINIEDLSTLATTTVAAGQTLKLTEDVQTTTRVVVEENAVLDGDNHLLAATGVDGAWVISSTLRFVEVAGGSTVKNLTIDGNNLSHDKYGIRGLYTVGTGDVTIENVTVRNCTYGINANNAGKLIIKNSTLQSWNSFGSTTTNEFENVTFIAGSYANVRPYNNTVFTNCEFTDVQLDLSELIAEAKVTFVNCTYNGEAITAANVETLINWDSYDAARVVVASTQTSIVVADGETYDGRGATVVAEDNRADAQNGLITPSGDATVQNVTIDGGNGTTLGGKVYRGIYITKAGTYNINNVKVLNCAYSINVNTTEAVVLNVTESYLQGCISFGDSTVATFTNVDFVAGDYNYFRPYGEVTLTNCDFTGMEIDLGSQKAGYKATFVNCTFDGAALTEANLSNAAGKNYEIK